MHALFQVLYQSDQFLDKNKDYVVPEHQDLLSASKCSFVAGLFRPLPEETAKPSKFSSIGSRFKVLQIMCYGLPFSFEWFSANVLLDCTKENHNNSACLAHFSTVTTTAVDGDIKFDRTSLYKMREAQYYPTTCHI